MESSFILSRLDRLDQVRDQLKKASGLSDGPLITPCDVCEPPDEPKDATSRCLDCKTNLCDGCLKFHSRFSKGHKLIDIAEANDPSFVSSDLSPSPSSVGPQFPPCSSHPSEKKSLFCLKCSVAICPVCLVKGDHQDHKFTLASDVVEEKKTQTSSLIKEVKDRRQDIETSLDLVGQAETKIQSSYFAEKQRIISFAAQRHQDIEDHKKSLLKQLKDRSREKLDRLKQQRKQLETDLECVDNSVSFSESLVKNATDDQFVSHLPLVTDQLGRLKEGKSFKQTPVETKHLEMVEEKKPFASFADYLHSIQVVETQSNDITQAINKAKWTPVSSSSSRVIAKADPRDYNSIGTPKKVFGSNGSGPGQFNGPRGVAVDQHNRIIVCDTDNNRVQIFDDQGNHIKCFGSQGSGPGQLVGPWGVAVDQHKRIIVTEYNGHRVQIFDDQGKYIKCFGSHGSGPGQFSNTRRVAVDQHNNIIVVDCKGHRLQIF